MFIDHEGGWGGSSRSLYYMVRSFDRAEIEPVVWYRQSGPLAKMLDEIGVESKQVPDLVSLTPRSAQHPANVALTLSRTVAAYRAARMIKAARADLLHFNYEGFVPLTVILAALDEKRPMVSHVRVMNNNGRMLRFYARQMQRVLSHVIFISENERKPCVDAGLDLGSMPSTVLHNTVASELFLRERPMAPDESRRFRVGYFGGIDDYKGVDRLVGVAERVKSLNARVVFDVFGRTGDKNGLSAFARSIANEIERRGLAETLTLRGHTSSPEAEMVASDLIIRPSRGEDPWGRDIIEAMCLGVPVLATGSYSGFVKHGRTGFLISPWDETRVAGLIADLDQHRETAVAMGRASRDVARALFDPEIYGRKISEIYRSVLAKSGLR